MCGRVMMMKEMLLVTVTMLMLAGCASLTPAEHYRRHQDGESLNLVLSEQIKPGDSIDTVKALLGAKTFESASHRGGLESSVRSYPQHFPEGLKDSDVVLFYPYDTGGLVSLIFRDGRLINYEPKRYRVRY